MTALKGGLRYWWRALMWGHHEDLERLRREEELLFGSADAGAGAFTMHLVDPEPCAWIEDDLAVELEGGVSPEGLHYLGHGLWDQGRLQQSRPRDVTTLPLSRPCVARAGDSEYRVRFLVHNQRTNPAQLDTLCEAIKALGLLGGIGSRARRGFGSLTLNRLSVAGDVMYRAPKTMEALARELGALIPSGAENAEYAAFDSRSRVIALSGRSGESGLDLLNRLGREMLLYRSWGRHGMVLGQRAEKNFRDDHHLMHTAMRGRRVSSHPRRIAFGLPQSYYFSSLRSGTSVTGESNDRRASPLWLHVHHVEEGCSMAVLSFLPGLFLPPGEQVKVGPRCRVELEEKGFWKPVEDFLERLLTQRSAEGFEEVCEIC